MGLAIALLTWTANRLNRTRIGRGITTGVASLVVAWAVLVAVLTSTLLVLAVLGYYP